MNNNVDKKPLTATPKQAFSGCASVLGFIALLMVLGISTTVFLRVLGLTKNNDRISNKEQVEQGIVEDNNISNNEVNNRDKVIKDNNDNSISNNNEDSNNINVEIIINDEIQKFNCTKTNNQIECREDVIRYRYRQSEECNVLNGDQCWFPFGR